MSIQIDGLTKRYAGVPVVSRVSLDIADGEMFVLLGPSGSGKSTLLRMIAGLADVDEGSVLLNGRDVTHISPSERGIGFVFQNYALFRNMTVAENIEFSLRVRKAAAADRRRRVQDLLEVVGLAGYGGRRPAQLSGGQQQRVALARALASAPPFLLLDEPFGALDARIRTELRQTLRAIQREFGVTAVFVTHDQEEAFELADRIGVMNFGQLLEVGPPQELYLRPRSGFVATFLGVSNFLVGESTPRSVRLGSVELPLGTESDPYPAGQRVQILFRPEDLELARDRTHVRSTVLGRGRVEDRAFSGPYERVRIRVEAIQGVRQISPPPPFGGHSLLFEVTRPQPEAIARPLQREEDVWIGARRAHVLAPAWVDIAVAGLPDEAGPARNFAAALAERMQGTLRYITDRATPQAGVGGNGAPAGQAEPESFGLTAIDRAAFDELALEPETWQAGHLIVVSEQESVPARFLVCVAVGEPGKVDVRLTERLAWRLGAEATVLTVLPGRPGTVPAHVTRFLEASARVLSARGVPTRTVVRHGPTVSEILAEAVEGGHDLIVVGAALPPRGRGAAPGGAVIARLLRERPRCPVLIVRSQ